MKKWFVFFLIAVISVTVIISVWFSEGKILQSTNEEDLNIFNSQNVAEDSSTVWYPFGTGRKVPFIIQRYPTFLFLSFINGLGMPPFLVQAVFMGVIMILGVTFMYLLMTYIFKLPWIYAAFGAFFYLLNLYSMSSIWKRLLYNHYIVWAYLPLFLLSWIKWIELGKIKWLILLLISSLIFSYTFAHPAFVLTFWITATIFTLYRIWINRNNSLKVLKTVLYFGVALMAWFLVNIWWAYPLLSTTSSYSENSAPSWQLNLSSLIGVSQYQDTKDIVLLRQSWVFGKDHGWFGFYNNSLIYLISIAILAILALGVLRSRSLKYRGFLISLLFLGWFISKGSNFPLGKSFYTLLFSVSPLAAVFRNPYEKFGNVFLVAYTIFFTLGLIWITKKFTSKILKGFFLGVSFLLFCGILVYPMWNGSIFPPEHRLSVPDYYTESNYYLNLISSERVFHVPFLLNESIVKYSWGYMAEDPLPNLFNSNSVSRPRVPIFDGIYKKIPDLMKDNNFPKILGMVGVDNIILHKDSIFPEINVASMSAVIDSWEGVVNNKQIGELVIYSLDRGIVKPMIYPAVSTVKVKNLDEGINLVLAEEINLDDSIFVEDFSKDAKRGSIPKIDFVKQSNISFKINIIEAENPFILVLNNTFDPNWQLKVDGKVVDNHFKVNGFANGWLVTKAGTYSAKINLKIWPWE